MSQPVEMTMPEHIGWQKVDQLIRELGFAPHQMRELTIDYTGPRPVPQVTVEVVANSQIVRRTYDTGRGLNGVRIGLPQGTVGQTRLLPARAHGEDRRCLTCHEPIHWVDLPTGSWWAHNVHPDDSHFAEPQEATP